MVATILRYAAAAHKTAPAPGARIPSYDRIIRLKAKCDAPLRGGGDVHIESDVIGNGVRVAELSLQCIAHE